MVRAAKSKIGKKEKNDRLYKAILTLETEEECYNFFQDLCTVSELRSMEQRFDVAVYLQQGMVYLDILDKTGASSATISVTLLCFFGFPGFWGSGVCAPPMSYCAVPPWCVGGTAFFCTSVCCVPTGCTGAPHAVQKRAPSLSGLPQFIQYILIPPSSASLDRSSFEKYSTL